MRKLYPMGKLATIGRFLFYIIMLVGGIVLNVIIDNPLIVAGISFVANYIVGNIGQKK